MKAIITKYLPASVHRGPRYVATDGDRLRVCLPEDPELDVEGNHQKVLRLACRKREWSGTMVGAGLKLPGGWVHVYSWVEFRHMDQKSRDAREDFITIPCEPCYQPLPVLEPLKSPDKA